jgi:hypothetical protein
MTKEMFEWITKWQRETFPQATGLSAANHLREEVEELIASISNENGIGNSAHEKHTEIISEYADCFLLLFGSASLYGLPYEAICHAINEKMEVNKKRKWGDVNAEGYVKHIEENKK